MPNIQRCATCDKLGPVSGSLKECKTCYVYRQQVGKRRPGTLTRGTNNCECGHGEVTQYRQVTVLTGGKQLTPANIVVALCDACAVEFDELEARQIAA